MYILYPILYESRPEIVISNKFKSQVLVTFIGDQKISSNTQKNPTNGFPRTDNLFSVIEC